jgi:transposase
MAYLVLCSGAPWRDLPERYGHWKTVYNRFNRWSKAGIMNSIFNKLLQILDEKKLVDWDVIALDGSNIRALKAAAGAKKTSHDLNDHGLGRSRGGFGTKIHLATDGTGLPLSFCLSGGQAHEPVCTSSAQPGRHYSSKWVPEIPGKTVLADKGYSSKKFRTSLKLKGINSYFFFKVMRKPAVMDAENWIFAYIKSAM